MSAPLVTITEIDEDVWPGFPDI
jgi:hypothetical protein